jgi:16S rRNA (adenine1518-N6/adenine1519-N6)-dimethyltransferase
MYAKKSLGQHFLRSERALNTIIESAKLDEEDLVLEIGPGQGVLTEKLLQRAGKVIAIEKDDGLYDFLQEKFKNEIGNQGLTLVHEDILNFSSLNTPYKLVANIPYNLTGAILEKFLSTDREPALIVLLVQKEVAERIVARDGKESILSISVKAYGKPHYAEKVLAGSFVPAPKVDSAIITIEKISKNFFNSPNGRFSEKDFFDLLHAGFKSKRKKLSSNLATHFSKEKVLRAFQKLKLDENLRAEDVSLGTWQKLSLELTTQG